MPGWFMLAPYGRIHAAWRRDKDPSMPLTAAQERAVVHLAGPKPVHAQHARQKARTLLAEWGLAESADLGELIAGELIANAIRHGEEPIWMRLSLDGGDLRVEVHDGGAGRPVRKHPGDDDESGRGLELLDGLTDLHGGERGMVSDPAGPGKTVYVVLSLKPTPADTR